MGKGGGGVTLRPYQSEAVASCFRSLARGNKSPLIVLPTGSGKSYVLSQIIKDIMQATPDCRVLMLTHVQELVQQNLEKLRITWPDAPVGIFHAGLKQRDTGHSIIFAGIQSAHRHLDKLGKFHVVVVDEAHLIPKRGEGMYRRALAHFRELHPSLCLIGLTATPFRLQGGFLHRGSDAMFDEVCIDVSVTRLVDEGYLSPLVPKRMGAQIDTGGVRVQRGDFIQSDAQRAAMAGDLVTDACREIICQGYDRKRWLIFAAGADHAMAIHAKLKRYAVPTGMVLGLTDHQSRADMVDGFRSGRLRALVNVGCFTTGFDVPEVDLLGVVRPTASPGLWVQILGRGMRPAEGKKDCLVLDFGGNTERLGPINDIQVPGTSGKSVRHGSRLKSCPQCRSYNPLGTANCEACGFEWPRRRVEHEREAARLELIRRDSKPEVKAVEVENVSYHIHNKKDKPPSLRVTYSRGFMGIESYDEWVCFEHGGYPRVVAERWWRERSSSPVPDTVEEALMKTGDFPKPVKIQVRRDGKYWRVIGYEWNPVTTTRL